MSYDYLFCDLYTFIFYSILYILITVILYFSENYFFLIKIKWGKVLYVIFIKKNIDITGN